MKEKTGSVLGVLCGVVAAAPTWTTAGILALLGVAGSTAAVIAIWLAPLLIGLSVLALGRAFYILYVLRRGTKTSAVITWLSAVFVVGFWTWKVVGST